RCVRAGRGAGCSRGRQLAALEPEGTRAMPNGASSGLCSGQAAREGSGASREVTLAPAHPSRRQPLPFVPRCERLPTRWTGRSEGASPPGGRRAGQGTGEVSSSFGRGDVGGGDRAFRASPAEAGEPGPGRGDRGLVVERA